ncbi:hypothetical protein C8F04DRAFT_1184223 [Mycena alexandri]|uniref:Uncharacterized protein n=1 Tax=Mycena alexandri TaxID=1745969 RepID=A0AAD6SVM0_9AGAR|nr:hypothetical protein C8F04DRAFT_1184223 [Mycena alexandri]
MVKTFTISLGSQPPLSAVSSSKACRMNNAAPFIAAAALNIDLTTLPNPYLRDGFGVVYINARVSKRAFRLWRRGILSTAQFLSLFHIKAVQPLRTAIHHHLDFSFATPRRMLLECLAHASVRLRGALPIRLMCGCGVRHREYVDCAAAGGIAAVEQDIVWWKARFGEAANSKPQNAQNLNTPGPRIDSKVYDVDPNVLCSMEQDSKFFFDRHRTRYLRMSDRLIDLDEARVEFGTWF